MNEVNRPVGVGIVVGEAANKAAELPCCISMWQVNFWFRKDQRFYGQLSI
jgi:hypothetical protein